MSKLRVLIVDDEALSRQRVRRLLLAEPDAEVIGECADGREAVEAIRRARPDLVCLDVQMPTLDGFAILQAIAPDVAPRVVFVTADEAHARRAFDVHAVDYVRKPIDAERFRRAIARVREVRRQAVAADRLGRLLDTVRAVADGSGPTPAESRREATWASRLLVKHEGRMFFVKVADIDWIEADRNYVRLHVGPVAHTIRERISQLEATLDPALFARIHRSTIVNLNRVREMQQWFSGDYVVLLEDGTRLRLSRHYREQVEQQVARR